MHNPKMNYFSEQEIIHFAITDDEEFESLELSPHMTAELNDNGDLNGVEILNASTILRDSIFMQ